MRNFWALPAFLRIALASQHAFSVFDDLLAFPQYEVIFPNTFITDKDATSLLSHSVSRSTSASPGSQETQELSKPTKQSSNTQSDDAPLKETYEAVVLGGQRYLCSIPVIPDEGPQNNTASAEEARMEEEKELVRASHRGSELLESMQGDCIYYLSGWWSYSFCYNDEVKQFHQLPPSRGVPIYPPVEDTSVQSYVLGQFPKKEKAAKLARKTLGNEEGTKETLDDEDSSSDNVEGDLEIPTLETRGASRYMVQRLSGGTECDLTGKERKIEVQFHCHPQSADKISMIKETSTCSYLMIIYTPRLCKDVAFQPPQENLAHAISCKAVIPEAEADEWTIDRLEDKIRETERLVNQIENENPLREMDPGVEGSTKRGPIIGGIEVGAKLLVGGEGKVIEKSVVVGGGKETYIGTVASSDGRQMSTAEMKKLNIHDPKHIEKLKKDVQKLAGRKGWKLDLIDTPQGREFRGIIDVDDEEQGAEDKGKGMGSKETQEGDSQGQRKEAEKEQQGSEEVYKDEL